MAQAAGFDQERIREKYLPVELRQDYLVLKEGMTSDLENLIPPNEILVVKVHGQLFTDIKELLLNGRIKITVSYRDPRDCVVSWLDTGKSDLVRPRDRRRLGFIQNNTFDLALNEMIKWVNYAEEWLSCEGVLPLFFDEVVSNPWRAARVIEKHLDLSVAVEPIVNKYLQNKELIGEFNVGRIGRYKECLSTEEQVIASDAFKGFLESFVEPRHRFMKTLPLLIWRIWDSARVFLVSRLMSQQRSTS